MLIDSDDQNVSNFPSGRQSKGKKREEALLTKIPRSNKQNCVSCGLRTAVFENLPMHFAIFSSILCSLKNQSYLASRSLIVSIGIIYKILLELMMDFACQSKEGC